MVDQQQPRKPGGRRKAVPGEEWLTTRPGSAAWHYDFTIDGHRLRGSCGTADFAAACAYAAAERDQEWRRIKLGEQPARHMTLDEAFAGFYLARAKGTRYGETGQKHQMARTLRILGTGMRLADLTNPVVARLVRGLRDGEGVTEGQEPRGNAKNATVNRYLATLRRVCAWAKDVEGAVVGEWSPRPHMLAEPPPKQNVVTMEEAAQLAAEIVPHARVPIALAVLTGARKANWLWLAWESVSLDMARAVVVGKGDKNLMLVLPPIAVQALEVLQPDPAKRAGPVFVYGLESVRCGCSHCSVPMYRGEPIRDIRRSFKTAAAKIEKPALRLHDLRHSHATAMLAATGNLALVQAQLHHSDVKTTLRYAHLMPGQRAAGAVAAVAGFSLSSLAGPAENTTTTEAPRKRKA